MSKKLLNSLKSGKKVKQIKFFEVKAVENE